MKGFHKSKRKPLYNQKYIDQAKRNIAKGEAEDLTDIDESEPWLSATPAHSNYAMYEQMILEDLKKRQKNNKVAKPAQEQPAKGPSYLAYPSIAGAETRLDDWTEIELIRDELAQLREELAQAKEHISRHHKQNNQKHHTNKTPTASKTMAPTTSKQKTSVMNKPKIEDFKDDLEEQAVQDI